MPVLSPLLLLLAACNDASLPDDQQWQPDEVTCPIDMPEAPDVDAADWTASSPPVGGGHHHLRHQRR